MAVVSFTCRQCGKPVFATIDRDDTSAVCRECGREQPIPDNARRMVNDLARSPRSTKAQEAHQRLLDDYWSDKSEETTEVADTPSPAVTEPSLPINRKAVFWITLAGVVSGLIWLGAVYTVQLPDVMNAVWKLLNEPVPWYAQDWWRVWSKTVGWLAVLVFTVLAMRRRYAASRFIFYVGLLVNLITFALATRGIQWLIVHPEIMDLHLLPLNLYWIPVAAASIGVAMRREIWTAFGLRIPESTVPVAKSATSVSIQTAARDLTEQSTETDRVSPRTRRIVTLVLIALTFVSVVMWMWQPVGLIREDEYRTFMFGMPGLLFLLSFILTFHAMRPRFAHCRVLYYAALLASFVPFLTIVSRVFLDGIRVHAPDLDRLESYTWLTYAIWIGMVALRESIWRVYGAAVPRFTEQEQRV